MTDIIYRFTDYAATRMFENGLDFAAVIKALEAGHHKQPAVEIGRFVHFVKVSDRPLKVVTAPDRADPDGGQAIITVLPLDVDLI
jgi:hypothetical protein